MPTPLRQLGRLRVVRLITLAVLLAGCGTLESKLTSALTGAGVGPDLVMEALTVPASSPIGATVAVTSTVRNLGSATTSPFRVAFYFSTDPTITTADVYTGSGCIYSGLAANTASKCNGPVAVPSSLPPGTYYVGAVLDDQGQVGETDEGNNALASATPTELSTATQPDLLMDAVSVPATSPIGGTVTVSSTVRNQGTTTTASFRVAYYFSTDATITTADVYSGSSCLYVHGLASSVTSNCSGPVAVPSSLSLGTYYVGAIVDDGSQVAESDEGNNARASATTTTLSTVSGPDLLLDAMTAPATGTIGGTVAVTSTVHNQGGPTSAPFRVAFYFSTDATITTADTYSGSSCLYLSGLAANTTSHCNGPVAVPGSLPPGNYYVGAIVDEQAQVSENDEANNTLAASGTTAMSAASGPGPGGQAADLLLETMTAPATGAVGGTVAVTSTVRNQGGATTASFRVAFYFSTDATITTADSYSGSSCINLSGLAANATSDCNGAVTVPSSLPAGTYYVGAIVDDLAQVTETDENNNARAAAATTVLSSSSGPDLLLDAMTAPSTATIGGTIGVTATVHNQGGATTSSFRVAFYYSTDATITATDRYSGSGCLYLSGLAANTTSNCSGPMAVPTSLPPGTYYVGAIVDELGQVSETDENNNTLAAAGTTAVSSASTPDLLMESVTAPATGTVGGTVAVSSTVRNQGGATTASFRVAFYFSTDTAITTADVYSGSGCVYLSGMTANTTSNCNGPVAVPSSLPPGTYYVGAIVDEAGAVTENDKTNNRRAAASTTVLSPASGPDLLMEAMAAPATGTAGGTIAVTSTVRNQGTTTPAAFRVAFYFSTDATITTADVYAGTSCSYASGLTANTTSNCDGPVTVPSALAPGTYYVGAIADDQDQVGEINEANNTQAAATTTVVSAGPDLLMEVLAAPATGAIGSTLAVTSTVRNQGTATNASFRVAFYLSTDATITTADTYTGSSCVLSGMPANSSRNCNGSMAVPGSLAPGAYYVGAIVDDRSQVTEIDETNNTLASAATTTLSVPGPDLLVDVMTAPATGAIGGTIAVTSTVRNQGAATTSAFRIAIYFSTDATITTADTYSGSSCVLVSGLAANTTSSCNGPVTVPSSLTNGTYYVGVIVDDLGQVAETAEDNNTLASATTTVLAVPGPDLLVDVIAAPATGAIGSTVAVTSTVRNQGAATTGAFRVAFYFSTDASITTADTYSGASCVYFSGLGANATSDCDGPVTVPSSLAPGSYYVGAIVDDQNQVNETNESNNTQVPAFPTVLTSGPDLVLGVIAVPATGVIGSTIAVTSTVRNQGAATTGSFRVAYYFSTDATITTADVYSGSGCVYTSGLAANAASSCIGPVTVPSSLPPGAYYVGAIVDDLGQVSETNENNNTLVPANTTVVSTVAPVGGQGRPVMVAPPRPR